MFSANEDGNKSLVIHSEELHEDLNQNVIFNENLSVYNYTILFDSFEYNNEICTVALVLSEAGEAIELNFWLVTPNGREPLTMDAQALIQFLSTGNIPMLVLQYTQTYLSGSKLLTPYLTFDLADKTVKVSAYGMSIYTSVEAGDSISLGDFYNGLETTAVNASYDELIPIFYKGEVVASVATHYESNGIGSRVYNVIRIYAIDKEFNPRWSFESVKWTVPNDEHRFAPFFLETDGNYLYAIGGAFSVSLYMIDLRTFNAQGCVFYLEFDNSELYYSVEDYIISMRFKDLSVESDNFVIRKSHKILGIVSEEEVFEDFGIIVIPKKSLMWYQVDEEGNADNAQPSPAFIFKCADNQDNFVVQSVANRKFAYLTGQDTTTLYARELDYGKMIGTPLYVEVIDDGVSDKMLASFESVVALGQVTYILYFGLCKNITFTDNGIEFYVVEKNFNYIMNGDENPPVKLSFYLFGKESKKQLYVEAHTLGVGFSEIVKNKLSNSHKLFISDKDLFGGKRVYIEFDADGNLVLDKAQIQHVVDNNLVVMSGASETTNGKAGQVPTPAAGNQDKFLRGDGSWMPAIIPQVIFDLTVPVKSTYTQYPGMPDPHQLYNKNGINSTWEVIDYDGAFFRAGGGNAAEFIESEENLVKQEESLQNITGLISGIRVDRGLSFFMTNNAFKRTEIDSISYKKNADDGYLDKLHIFDASLSNDAYGRREEVAPANYTIRIWKRTA